MPCARVGHCCLMFLFFSNRLGCAGSIALSLIVTAILLYALSR